MPTKLSQPVRPNWTVRIVRMGAILLASIVAASLIGGIAAQSLGAIVRLVPGFLIGIVTLFLLFRRAPNWKWAGAFLALFVITAGIPLSYLWKFIQPTVWPLAVVPDGNPWVIEGNIFTNNDYNNAVVVVMPDGRYRMYFHDHNDMMSAISSDGLHFTLEGKLFEGEMPAVIRLADGTYRMYYFVNVQQNQPPPQFGASGDELRAPDHNLVSAVSSDGLHWTQESGVRLAGTPGGYDQDSLIHPTVIQLGDGSYKLYYDGETEITSPYSMVQKERKIMSASSKDGLTWTKDPGYRIDEQPLNTWEAYSSKAMYKNGTVILYFTTPNGIYKATSADTLHFAISKNPVFSPGRVPMPDGDNGVLGSYQDAFIMPVQGGNRMYFWIEGKGIFSAFQKS